MLREYFQFNISTVLAAAICVAVGFFFAFPIGIGLIDGLHQVDNIIEELWFLYVLCIPILGIAVGMVFRFRVAHVLASIALFFLAVACCFGSGLVLYEEYHRFLKAIQTTNVDQFGFFFFLMSFLFIGGAFFLLSICTEMRVIFYKNAVSKNGKILRLATMFYQSIPFWMTAAFGCVFVDDINFRSQILNGARSLTTFESFLLGTIAVAVISSLFSILLTFVRARLSQVFTIVSTTSCGMFLFVFLYDTMYSTTRGLSREDTLAMLAAAILLLVVWLFYIGYMNTPEVKGLFGTKPQDQFSRVEHSTLDYELLQSVDQ